jgi:hypothetical protein
MAARVIFGPLKVPVEHGHGHTAHGAAHGQADVGQGATPDRGHGDHGHGVVKRNDLNAREILVLAPIAFAVILLGVKPNLVLGPIRQPIQAIAPAESGRAVAGTGEVAPAVATRMDR